MAMSRKTGCAELQVSLEVELLIRVARVLEGREGRTGMCWEGSKAEIKGTCVWRR